MFSEKLHPTFEYLTKVFGIYPSFNVGVKEVKKGGILDRGKMIEVEIAWMATIFYYPEPVSVGVLHITDANPQTTLVIPRMYGDNTYNDRRIYSFPKSFPVIDLENGHDPVVSKLQNFNHAPAHPKYENWDYGIGYHGLQVVFMTKYSLMEFQSARIPSGSKDVDELGIGVLDIIQYLGSQYDNSTLTNFLNSRTDFWDYD